MQEGNLSSRIYIYTSGSLPIYVLLPCRPPQQQTTLAPLDLRLSCLERGLLDFFLYNSREDYLHSNSLHYYKRTANQKNTSGQVDFNQYLTLLFIYYRIMSFVVIVHSLECKPCEARTYGIFIFVL